MNRGDDIRKLAMALPGVEEKSHFGSPSFRCDGRIFIQISGEKDEAIFRLSPVHQEILFETRPEAFRAEIWGTIRWSRLMLDQIPASELKELVQEAYDQLGAKPKKPAKAKPRKR